MLLLNVKDWIGVLEVFVELCCVYSWDFVCFNCLFLFRRFDLDDMIRFIFIVCKNYWNVFYYNWVYVFFVVYVMFIVIKMLEY